MNSPITKQSDYIINWIKKYFEQNGPDSKAIIGISGGKDSSIVAALCVEALGKDRVFGVLMPQGQQPDLDMALDLVKYLDIKYDIANIEKIVDNICACIPIDFREHTKTNIPPRVRMTILYAVAQELGGRVANTCNKSEDYVGYSTKFGDTAGDFSPLSNYTVREVKQIGRELGLPDKFIDKKPEDGLSGKTDEDNLGFTYEELDSYILNGIEPEKDKLELIENKHKYNLHKVLPMPTCPNINNRIEELYEKKFV